MALETVDAEMFDFYYGPDVPFVSMLSSVPEAGMTINTANPYYMILTKRTE